VSAAPPPVATGLIGILRGLHPHEAADVGQCLYDAGLRTLEVPLNSPDPFASVAAMRAALPADCVVGAGTVLTVEDVRRCLDAGAQVVVSPNTDVHVIAETVRLGMASLPGAATPSEAFSALAAGADGVKVFPAEQVGVAGMRAWTAVLPAGVGLVPVGGVHADNLADWLRAGATGFGIGSSLYTPGTGVDELSRRARALVEALSSARRAVQEHRPSSR
jgi:2-dehydro-3-deoxyphosphogalactonate aldolase